MIRKAIIFALVTEFLTIIDVSIGSILKISLPLVFLSIFLPMQDFPFIFVFASISGILLDFSFGVFQGQYFFSIILATSAIFYIKRLYSLSRYFLSLIFFLIVSIFFASITKNFRMVISVFVYNVLFSFLIITIIQLVDRRRGKYREERV